RRDTVRRSEKLKDRSPHRSQVRGDRAVVDRCAGYRILMVMAESDLDLAMKVIADQRAVIDNHAVRSHHVCGHHAVSRDLSGVVRGSCAETDSGLRVTPGRRADSRGASGPAGPA